ncbi:MAG: ATP synthase F1 subunit delta [Candidatus Sumerlaeota bacterium]|nr:ATP synthase F1 subunit delta [Candidatus Sumerlaeota bacterium]
MRKSGARYHRQAAFNYAEALFRLAKRRGMDLAALVEQAGVLRQAVSREGSKLRRFLDGPQIPTQAKLHLVRRALHGRVEELFVNLFSMLVERDRTVLSDDILEIFSDMVASDQGIHYGQVATAVELDEPQKGRLRTVLERFTRSRLRIAWMVAPEVLGGVVFQYKDILVDFSVHGRLEALRHRLQAVKVV